MDEKAKTGLVALLVTLSLSGALGAVLWLSSPRRPGEQAAAQKGKAPAPVAAGPQKAEEQSPYPESAACLEYLRKRAREPDSLRVVEWLGRHEHPVQGDTWVNVRVRVRSKNAFGGWDNQVQVFNLKDGRVMNHGEVPN
jgi:hypothetical protein